MKKVFATLLFAGMGVYGFAQPTSGDPILPEPMKKDSIVLAHDKDSVTYIPNLLVTQQTFESIFVHTFTKGKAAVLAKYFGDNVDLSILGKANVYSRSQGEQVLQHFFDSHKPNDFKIIHQGDASEAQYFIGEMSSVKGKKFRVTMNSKTSDNKTTVLSLSIEAS
jgi:hypothetical protein